MKQLMDEKNQHLIDSLFAALNLSIELYLPLDEVNKFRKEAADFFLLKAKKDSDSKQLQRFCLDKALTFTA